ncbi:LTA synthase family protein [Candidatus Margulisiibacteriota bacterium]
MYQVFVTDDIGGLDFSPKTILIILLSVISVFLFFQIISTVFSYNKKHLVAANIFTLFLYSTLVAYHFGAQELLNWSVLSDNITIAFSTEAADVIWSSLDPNAFLYFLAFAAIFLGMEKWKKTMSKAKQEHPLRLKIAIGLIIYLIFIFIPIDSFDPFVNFFRSVAHHYISPVKIDLQKDKFLPLNDGKAFANLKLNIKKKPNVFLIVIESLNASSLGKASDSGKAYTPFMNKLSKDSVYVKRFYGNSIQTAKGHFATYFSVIPSVTGKSFVKHKELKLDSIASILKRAGYDTTYFIAHRDKNFDNEYNFLTSRGYDDFLSVEDYLKAEDSEKRLTWGVEDSVFYKRFFDYFDSQDIKSPQFVTLVTIANHFPFKSASEERRFVYKNPKTFEENYANSIHLVDLGLKTFFAELKKRGLAKNSIVIITGDHAYPLGEHNNYHLEAGFNEESFRTPLFLLWPNKIKPQVIKTAYSQMDIAPTIVDLLNLKIGKNNFQGTSIFAKNQKPVFLIQPYGKHLEIVSYPFKYRYFDKTNQEFVYNLQKDPMETTNIISSLEQEKIAFFRKNLRRIYYNQYLIKNNLFWDENCN